MSGSTRKHGTSSPIVIVDALEITKSGHGDDQVDVWDGIRNGTASAGDVKVKLISGNDHTFNNIPSGGTVYARIERIYETGTSLATIEALAIE